MAKKTPPAEGGEETPKPAKIKKQPITKSRVEKKPAAPPKKNAKKKSDEEDEDEDYEPEFDYYQMMEDLHNEETKLGLPYGSLKMEDILNKAKKTTTAQKKETQEKKTPAAKKPEKQKQADGKKKTLDNTRTAGTTSDIDCFSSLEIETQKKGKPVTYTIPMGDSVIDEDARAFGSFVFDEIACGTISQEKMLKAGFKIRGINFPEMDEKEFENGEIDVHTILQINEICKIISLDTTTFLMAMRIFDTYGIDPIEGCRNVDSVTVTNPYLPKK